MQSIFKRLAKDLIRLRICAGWSEPLLVAHTTLLEISCHGSYVVHIKDTIHVPMCHNSLCNRVTFIRLTDSNYISEF